MSELHIDQDPQQRLRAAIAERAQEQLGWLQEAAEIIGGPGAQVTEVFPAPVVEGDKARNDAPIPDWTEEQTEQVWVIGRRFGYGARETVQSGLSGGMRIAEGGKVWKMLAEVEAFKSEDNPNTEVICGSPFRQLGEDELTFLTEKRGIHLSKGATEYDFALALGRLEVDGLAADEPVPQSLGYETSPGNPTTTDATGQLVYIGNKVNGQGVLVLRIEGEQYVDDEGKTRERNRPDTARVMTMMAEKLTNEGNLTDPIAEGTSNTYASRMPDTVRASLSLDPPRQFGAVFYGRETLGSLGAPVPNEMGLNHLPGDLRVMHDKLQQLLAEAKT